MAGSSVKWVAMTIMGKNGRMDTRTSLTNPAHSPFYGTPKLVGEERNCGNRTNKQVTGSVKACGNERLCRKSKKIKYWKVSYAKNLSWLAFGHFLLLLPLTEVWFTLCDRFSLWYRAGCTFCDEFSLVDWNAFVSKIEELRFSERSQIFERSPKSEGSKLRLNRKK